MYTFKGINQKLLKILYIFILLALISFLNISGCGSNGDSNTIGPEGGTITTSDGRFTLEIPPGALTEDTEIVITRDESFDGDVLVYDAQPAGLEFLIPAILTGDVTDISNNDGSNINVMIGFNVTDESAEELGDQIYEVDISNGNATYTAEIDHFSSLNLLNGAVKIEHATVPSMNPANSLLVEFFVDITLIDMKIDMNDIFREDKLITTIDNIQYFDFSSPMVLYNGQTTPFNKFNEEKWSISAVYVAFPLDISTS